MPTRWPWAKRMKPGRGSWRMRRGANSRRSTLRWTRSGRNASRPCRITRRFPGTRSTCGSSIGFRAFFVPSCGTSDSMGDISHHSHRVRTRLSLWMRVLHGHGFLRRLDPLPVQPEHRRGDAQDQTARPRQPRARSPYSSSMTISRSTSSAPSRFCATSLRREPNFRGWGRSAPTCCGMKNCWI